VVGGQCHAPAALPPRKTRYPLHRRLGGPQGRSGRVRKISRPQGLDPWTFQSVAISHTDWAIPAQTYIWVLVLLIDTLYGSNYYDVSREWKEKGVVPVINRQLRAETEENHRTGRPAFRTRWQLSAREIEANTERADAHKTQYRKDLTLASPCIITQFK